ncbi:MAG: hypothetical protein M3336_01110, partial [Chloroflexota bacterium]|nr:hypothetical protein [Chloroflexota bacterium]
MLPLAAIAACIAVECALLPIGIDEVDEGYFAQLAMRIVAGQLPYREFESLYTPGLHYVHAALFVLLGGPYLLAPRALSVVFRAAVAALLYVIARPLVRRPLWAALPGLFLLVGLDPAPDLWEPHPGWPSTLCALLAAWSLSHRPTTPWLLGAGVAAASAFAFKQNTGAYILAALLVRGFPRPKQMVLPALAFSAVTAAWIIPLLAAIDGQVSLLAPFVGGGLNLAALHADPEPTIMIPLLCLAAGLALARGTHDPRLHWYLLAGSALFMTQFPRSDTVHLLWSAPLLLVLGAAALQRAPPAVALVVLASALLLCLPVAQSRIQQVRQGTSTLHAPYATGIKVAPATAVNLTATVDDLRARTAPGEAIFVYPSSPLLYVLAERPNATRFEHLYAGAATTEQMRQVIADVLPVRVVVISEYWRIAWG